MMRPIVAMLLLTALTGCGGSPKTNFFTLDAVPAGSSPTAGWSGSPLEVGQVQLPPALDRESIVTRGAGQQLNVSDQDRWAGPLDQLLRGALSDDLRARLPSGAVLAPGDPTPRGTRVLTVNVQRFMADASGHVVLEADWSMNRNGNPGEPRHVRVEAQASGADGTAVASAMSQALGKLADRMTGELG